MSRAQEFLKKESLSPGLRSEAIVIYSQLEKFLARYKMSLSDLEQDAIEAALIVLKQVKTDE